MAALEHLFAPLRLGPVELRNRIVSTAHQTTLVHNHLPTDDFVAYHEARARGGVGLIVLEATAIHPSALLTSHTPGWISAGAGRGRRSPRRRGSRRRRRNDARADRRPGASGQGERGAPRRDRQVHGDRRGVSRERRARPRLGGCRGATRHRRRRRSVARDRRDRCRDRSPGRTATTLSGSTAWRSCTPGTSSRGRFPRARTSSSRTGAATRAASTRRSCSQPRGSPWTLAVASVAVGESVHQYR
jgi:hypothetical protein